VSPIFHARRAWKLLSPHMLIFWAGSPVSSPSCFSGKTPAHLVGRAAMGAACRGPLRLRRRLRLWLLPGTLQGCRTMRLLGRNAVKLLPYSCCERGHRVPSALRNAGSVAGLLVSRLRGQGRRSDGLLFESPDLQMPFFCLGDCGAPWRQAGWVLPGL